MRSYGVLLSRKREGGREGGREEGEGNHCIAATLCRTSLTERPWGWLLVCSADSATTELNQSLLLSRSKTTLSRQGDTQSSTQSTWVWNAFLEPRRGLAEGGQEHEKGPVSCSMLCPVTWPLGHISSQTLHLPIGCWRGQSPVMRNTRVTFPFVGPCNLCSPGAGLAVCMGSASGLACRWTPGPPYSGTPALRLCSSALAKH